MPASETAAPTPLPGGLARTPTSRRGQAKRAKLLAAAEECFGRLGYNNASVAEIVRVAGVSQGGFYVYFEGKDAIFRELVMDISRQIRAASRAAIEGAATQQEAELAGTRAFLQWLADHPLGAGLRTRDIELASAEIFRPAPGDITVARSDARPLIVARPGPPKIVVLGFNPVRSGLKYQLTTPLLFANIIRWMEPDAFRSWELTAGAAGTVDVELESETDPNTVRVQTEDGKSLPFTIEGKTLRFFTADPGIVRVLAGDRELVYSLTLPQPGDTVWQPANVKFGLPGRAPAGPASRDIWQWLAIAGAAGLLADWILYGRIDRRIRAANGIPSADAWRKAS